MNNAYSANLVLWATYARLLLLDGKKEQSNHIFETCLKMIPSINEKATEKDDIVIYTMVD